MLEYIWTLLSTKSPNTLQWTDNLKILNESITIDLNVINANLKKFETNIDLLYDRLQSANETQYSGKNFVHKMKPFYDDSCKQLSTFTDSVKKLNRDLKELGEWFDVEDGDNLEFLKQINTFRKTFQTIGPRLIKRAKDAEKKAKRKAKMDKMSKSKKKRKVPKFIGDGGTLIAKGDKKTAGPKGGVAIPGFGRRGSILRAVAQKKPLNLDAAGNLAPQRSGSTMMPPGMGGPKQKSISVLGRARGPSISRAGGLRNELWKFAASVDNKVKV